MSLTSPGRVPGRAGGHGGCPRPHLAMTLGELGDTGDIPHVTWLSPWASWGHGGCPRHRLAVSLVELGDMGDVPNIAWP